jgi:ankyrin repeat protein
LNLLLDLETVIRNNAHRQLKELLKKDPEITFLVDPDGSTLLIWAVGHNAFDCINLLVQHGVNINQPNKFGVTALISAVLCSNFKIARYLLEQGADISFRTKTKNLSAFDFAMHHKNEDNVKWFHLFDLYKDRLSDLDLICYDQHRLLSLLYPEQI